MKEIITESDFRKTTNVKDVPCKHMKGEKVFIPVSVVSAIK